MSSNTVSLYSDGTNGCRMEINNQSPFRLTPAGYCTDHGFWEVLPPVTIEAFSTESFRVKDLGAPLLHQYSGSEASVTYVANDTSSSKFQISCNVPYNGMKLATLSNPNPSQFSTFFFCGARADNATSQLPELSLNSCDTTSRDLNIQYNIKSISSAQILDNPHLSTNGSTYIKTSNVMPHALHLMSSKAQLGFWDESLKEHVNPYSTTEYAQLFQDIATGEQSKGSAFYAFVDANDKLHGMKIEFYNPQDNIDECKQTNATDTCEGADYNFVRVSNPDTTAFNTYYKCSSDGETWHTNYCDKSSNLLYVHVFIVGLNE